MTDVLDTAPEASPSPGEGTHPVTSFVSSLARALDRVADVSGWTMTPEEQRHALVELRRQRARLKELELRVLVAADRNDVGGDVGATSTAAWLADATGSARADCFRDVHLAHALDEELQATRASLAAGLIDVPRAADVVSSVRALTDEHDDLPDGPRAAAEAHLLAQARRFDVVRLRRLGKRLYEVVCPEAADAEEGRLPAAEEEYARRLSYVTLRDSGDGSVDGRFRLPTLHADLLRSALDALTSPRRLGDGRSDPTTGGRLSASSLRGRGLMELLEGHLDLTTVPGHAGSPFTVVVTVGLEALQTGLGVAAVDTGCRVSAGEARRLACRAGIIAMVLDRGPGVLREEAAAGRGRGLAQRGYQQAWVFGTYFLFMREVEEVAAKDGRFVARIGGVGEVTARAVVLATGVSYRRLGVPELEAMTGAGVYYGANVSAAQGLTGLDAVVVGGGNSAGQAVLHLAKYCRRVTLVVRGADLGAGMSSYLVEAVGAAPDIVVRLTAEVVGGGGETRLQHVVVRDRVTGEEETLPADGLFVMIGARPRTDWLPPEVARDRFGHVLAGNDVIEAGAWPLRRAPYPYESSVPGLFAVGDVRCGSVKRVASAVGEGSVVVSQVHELFKVPQ